MADDQPEKGGSKLKIIIISAVAVVLLLVIGIGATLFFTGAFSHKSKADGTAKAAVEKHPPIYFSIKPAMVVNFQNPTKARYLQVEIDVMARNPKVISAVKENMPAIRNRLIILLSGQQYDEISTATGKEKLRKEVLDSINGVLEQSGDAGKVEKVYFTNFVMQ